MQVRILTNQIEDRFFAEALSIGDDEHVFHITNTWPSKHEAYQAAHAWAEDNGHKVFTAANGHTVIA